MNDELARRVHPKASLQDLPLPDEQARALRQVADAAGPRAPDAPASSPPGGVGALFVGPPGAGKARAAEALAKELGKDLLRVDLGQLASKYIGETEKNLARVFDAAAQGGAVLLFEEADALFGKRTGVKDSHDRYAHSDVDYLLQRAEAHPGLTVLAAGLRGNLDPALVRRLKFVVEFQPPSKERTPLAREAGEE